MIIIVKFIASVLFGVLAGCGAVYTFNKMPAKWLCDYGQVPPQELTDPYIQRVKGYPGKWLYSAGFACLLIRLLFFDVQFAVAGLFACWALLMIGLADLKYMIIPDQFVIMLALSAIGFIPCHESAWSPVMGLIVGGGVMLITGLIGGAIFKKEVMGFGDVKLFAALGVAIGIKGTLIVLIASSICSGIAASAGLASGKYKKDDMKPLGPYICGWGAFYIFIIAPMLIQI